MTKRAGAPPAKVLAFSCPYGVAALIVRLAMVTSGVQSAAGLEGSKWKIRPMTETSLLRRTEAALDAILRGNHAGWDQALAALRKELREALGLG